MTLRMTGTLSLLAAFSSFAMQVPANGLDLESLLRNWLGSSPPNTAAPNQALIQSNINTRQAQIEQEIASGVASGQLTAEEAADLRLELGRIAAVEGGYLSDGQLTYAETQMLVDSLGNLSRRLHAYLTNASAAGAATLRTDRYPYGGLSALFNKYVGSGSPDAVAPNQRLIQSNIDTRQAELEAKIDDARRRGLISWSESAHLRAQLNDIAQREWRYLADGHFTYGEEQKLVLELNQLSDRLNDKLRKSAAWSSRGWGHKHGHRRGGIDWRQSNLRDRINRGVASGTITQREADRLYRMEQRINELESKLRASGGRLTYSEEQSILSDLDNLSRRIDESLYNRRYD